MGKTARQLTLTSELMTARELRELAPFAARSDRSRGRRHEEPEHPYRSIYMRDGLIEQDKAVVAHEVALPGGPLGSHSESAR